MPDRLTVFPFWSWREKSGAVSPAAKLRAEEALVVAEALQETKASAEVTVKYTCYSSIGDGGDFDNVLLARSNSQKMVRIIQYRTLSLSRESNINKYILLPNPTKRGAVSTY